MKSNLTVESCDTYLHDHIVQILDNLKLIGVLSNGGHLLILKKNILYVKIK